MKQIILLIFSLSTCCLCLAQVHRNYTTFSVENGLAQNTVWEVFQDYRGYLWISTADGVNRFDGYKMKHYKSNKDDSNSIGGVTGFHFLEDSKQQLWIAYDKGIAVYDRMNDCFRNVYQTPQIVSKVGEDENGRIWFLAGEERLVALDRESKKIVKQLVIADESKNTFGSTRNVVKVGHLFCIAVSHKEIITLNTKNDTYKRISLPREYGTCFGYLSDTSFFSMYQQFVYTYRFMENRLVMETRIFPERNRKQYLFTGYTHWKNKIYAGSPYGLFVFDPRTFAIESHTDNFSNTNEESYYYIQSVNTDRSDNLYLCTNGGGIKVWSPYKNKFEHYRTKDEKTNMVKAIVSLPEGKIAAGLYGEGLVLFNKNGSYKLKRFVEKKEIAGVLAVTLYAPNQLLLTNDNEFILYDYQRDKELMRKNMIGLSYPFFFRQPDKSYLTCFIRNDTNVLARFSTPQTIKEIILVPNAYISCAVRLSEGKYLVGSDKRLLLCDEKTQTIRNTNIQVFVKSICKTQKGRIFVGTIEGLFEVNEKAETLDKYDVSNGLPDDFIYGVLEDSKGHIWMSHNKGLSRLDLNTGQLIHYSKKDGLQSNEFNTGAFCKDEKGLLYFGGVNGVNIIDPNNLIRNTRQPQLSINEILLGDLPYHSDTAYNEKTTLKLTYLENTLSFDFSALEFSQPEENTYMYKLEGYDNNWIQSGTRHFARYANLPHGRYTFKIKAANGDGVWNETPKEINILINPPFWKTIWFYALLGIGLISILTSLIYIWINRQKIRITRELEIQQKLEQERLRISRDLHDNVGAQLSYLITNIEWMLEHPDQISESEEQQRLKALSETGRNAILTLRQTIWAISNTTLSVEEFADRFKQFALKMLEFNDKVHVHFRDDFKASTNLSPAVALNMFRICQEAFNNCLKHAQCSEVHIHFESNEAITFGFTIEDNGIGFDWNEAQRKGHYGLVNMQARASETNASLTIQSEKGKGTHLVLQLK
ncbi:MAG: two-component regulator propeller domain-containing protein [Bacteroidota bacterium]